MASKGCNGMEADRRRPGGRSRSRLLAYGLLGFVVLTLCWPGGMPRRLAHLTVIWAPVALWRTNDKVMSALHRSGPVFIKLAQWLSTRRDVLDDELCDAMGLLHENVPASASEADLRQAETDVPGLKVGRLLGGGCIAQVYEGELTDAEGRPHSVAVKVRRQGVEDLLHKDLRFLRWAGWCAERIWPDLAWLSFESAVDNFGGYLTQQVDLNTEAANARRFRENFQGTDTNVPRVVTSTEAVMVTELAYGMSLSQFVKRKYPEPLRRYVFNSLTDIMARMILVDGFIHGDMHPGNVFIEVDEEPRSRPPFGLKHYRKPKVTLIDMGIAINMTEHLSIFARDAMMAALQNEPLKLGQALTALHETEGLMDFVDDVPTLERKAGCLLLSGCFTVKEDVWSEVFDSWEAYMTVRVSEYFNMMISTLSSHKVRVSPALWSIMTAFALIEGSVYELGFGINVLKAATPYMFKSWDMVGLVKSKIKFWESMRRHDAHSVPIDTSKPRR
eukprot:TRINITY_DN47378_c0_g2_i1.p1 TRINITY_DN47378_c0_g2~~TRINITY_DN47378_c0_g2_i1.p1  ORF type:complete len:502 (-),score=102.72 TRINITY_DN47378_c0_g2_i1:122-1627(-)